MWATIISSALSSKSGGGSSGGGGGYGGNSNGQSQDVFTTGEFGNHSKTYNIGNSSGGAMSTELLIVVGFALLIFVVKGR